MLSNGVFAGIFFVLLLVYKAVGLRKHTSQARATGLPYVITPTLETEIWGYILTPILRKVYHNYLLKEQGWPQWCRFMIKDWAWEDRRRAHDQYGDVFLVVSPEGIICYSADAPFNHDVMNRRNEFTKPRDKYKILEPYGPNVATAEGKTYRFHVRITAPPFSDMSGANDLVWSETMQQTRKLTSSWSSRVSRELQLDVNGLTLAVISRAGFGKPLNWTSQSMDDAAEIPSGYKLSFLRAIHDTTGYMAAILLLPNWLMRLTPLKNAALAHSQLDRYMREMIGSEKSKIRENLDHQSELARGNLLTSVLRASASEAAEQGKKEGKPARKEAFTDDEVMGNLFIYLLAGYETTANAILYGLIVLALRPDLQEKVIQEIDQVCDDAAKEGRDLTYANDFEKLEYTYGFMYETLRLFPGVTMITKMIHTPTTVHITTPHSPTASNQHLLPAGCRIYLNSPATHYSPRWWPSPTTLDPSRWSVAAAPNATATAAAEKGTTAAGDAEKKIVAADRTRQMRGTFLTFSDGARACLGRKFAQAEYLAFFVVLLRDYEVVLGEGMDAASVERDIYLRCAGKVTLSPLDNVKLGLRERVK